MDVIWFSNFKIKQIAKCLFSLGPLDTVTPENGDTEAKKTQDVHMETSNCIIISDSKIKRCTRHRALLSFPAQSIMANARGLAAPSVWPMNRVFLNPLYLPPDPSRPFANGDGRCLAGNCPTATAATSLPPPDHHHHTPRRRAPAT